MDQGVRASGYRGCLHDRASSVCLVESATLAGRHVGTVAFTAQRVVSGRRNRLIYLPATSGVVGSMHPWLQRLE